MRNSAESLRQAARILRTVSHPVRIDIIGQLAQIKHLTVTQIQGKVGATQSMTSQHLAALKNVGIVDCKRDANTCLYYLKNRKVLQLLNCVQGCIRNK